MADVCACEIHESGRGLSPCMGHSRRIAEHQQMFKALDAIARGDIEGDPGEAAIAAILGVRWWHRDHPDTPVMSGERGHDVAS